MVKKYFLSTDDWMRIIMPPFFSVSFTTICNAQEWTQHHANTAHVSKHVIQQPWKCYLLQTSSVKLTVILTLITATQLSPQKLIWIYWRLQLRVHLNTHLIPEAFFVYVKCTFLRRDSETGRLFMAATLVISCLASSVLPLSNNHLADSGMNLSTTQTLLINRSIPTKTRQKRRNRKKLVHTICILQPLQVEMLLIAEPVSSLWWNRSY